MGIPVILIRKNCELLKFLNLAILFEIVQIIFLHAVYY